MREYKSQFLSSAYMPAVSFVCESVKGMQPLFHNVVEFLLWELECTCTSHKIAKCLNMPHLVCALTTFQVHESGIQHTTNTTYIIIYMYHLPS